MSARTGRPAGLSRLWDRALDLVFPPRCVSCGAFGAFVCRACAARMTPASPPRCAACWMPSDEETCGRCRRDTPALAGVRAAFVYQGTARDAVHALKFDGVSAAAPSMAEAMLQTLLAWSPPVEVVVPVPLSGRRRRVRGYNQSELLARCIADGCGLPLQTRALVRTRDTAPQARQQDEKARRGNVAGAFGVGPRVPRGAPLLVDDVATTGATLDACARVLLGAGAAAVFALTYARED